MPNCSMKFYYRFVFLSFVGVVLCVGGVWFFFAAFLSSSSSSHEDDGALSLSNGDSDLRLSVAAPPRDRRRNGAFTRRQNDNNNNNNQQSSIPNVFPLADAACPASSSRFADVDFHTIHLYDFLNMTGRGGGDEDWMDLNFGYDVSRWRHDPLRVFVVPFSHSDPGWHKTAEEHFLDDSFHTINNAVLKLHQHKTMTFIWAESIYLSWWWQGANSTMRQLMKDLLTEGRFEVVGGGWVMPDEANPTAYSIVDQLLEGHLFLKQNLGYKPTSGFAIDPFGHSSVVARVAGQAGLKHIVLQRIHYDLKKFFDHTANAEFKWRQLWDVEGANDVFAYMNPYRLYAYKFTCGPDYRVCLEYDFQDVPGAWRDVKGTPINRFNIKGQSLKLLNQLRKKSLLFKHNVLLVLLGDDFRYTTGLEFDQQFANWNQLFEFLNANSRQLFVEAKFGTLKDYFAAVESALARRNPADGAAGGGRREEGSRRLSLGQIKSVGGDFFTYDDENVSYWSGFYTSRMAWKILGRRLESSLRAADVFFALSADRRPSTSDLKRQDFLALQQARQNLALFQHHDDVTGTSTDHNMNDLARRLAESIEKTQSVLAHAAWISLTEGASAAASSTGSRAGEASARAALVPTVIPDSYVVGMKQVLVEVRKNEDDDDDGGDGAGGGDRSSLLVLTNSLPFKREEIVSLRVNSLHVRVVEASGDPRRRDGGGRILPHQIDPVWSNNHNHISTGMYSLLFRVELGPFQVKRLVIEATPPRGDVAPPPTLSLVGVLSFQPQSGSRGGGGATVLQSRDFRVEERTKEDFVLSNGCLAAVFDGATSGHLRRVVRGNATDDRSQFDSNVEFLSYNSDHSGAYLFLPDGPARSVSRPLKAIVVSGPLQSSVRVIYPWAEHVVTMVGGRVVRAAATESGGGGGENAVPQNPVFRILAGAELSAAKCKSSSLLDSLSITNHVNLKNAIPNNELIMRVRTDIDSGDLFYTDSNALEMVKRKRFAKLPIQGNYYPMPLAAYVEDATARRRRMTLLAGQPQGVSSLSPGVIEVMQDRILMNDDYRGLGQGVMDNKLSVLRYVLLFEETDPPTYPGSPPPSLPHLSLAAHHLAQRLNHPVDSFVRSPDFRVDLPTEFLPATVDFLTKPFPCDAELMSLRPMPILEENTSDADKLLPSRNASALMILNRPGFDCRFTPAGNLAELCSTGAGDSLPLAEFFSPNVRTENSRHVSLTMMETLEYLGNDASLTLRFKELKSFLIDIRKRHNGQR